MPMDPAITSLFQNPNFWAGAIKAREEIGRQIPTAMAGLERLYKIETEIRKGRKRLTDIPSFVEWINSGVTWGRQ